MKDFVPEKTLNGYKMDVKCKNDKFIVWYKAPPRYVESLPISKNIEADDLFWEVLGILQGEMKKSIKNLGYANISFANSNPDIINHALIFFKKFFNIKRNMWRVTPGFNTKNVKIDNKYKFEIHIKDFWQKKTKIPIKNFTKLHFNPKAKTVLAKNGFINLKYCNSAFASFFINLTAKIKPIIENNKEISEAYIRGILAADGSPYIRKGYLNTVEIGAKKDENKKHYKKCLEVMGINNIYFGKTKVRICNWNNFYRLWQMRAFKLHKPRELKFVNGFMKNQETRKLLLLNELEKPKTMNDLGYLKLAKRTLHEHFANFFKKGLLNRSRIFNKNGSWYYVWTITPEGEKIKESFKVMEDVKLECERYVF